MIKVELILASSNYYSKKIATYLLTYPRFIHAEVLRHRMLSHSAESSRAVPTDKIIERVEKNPVIPLHWGQNQKGMQAFQEISEENQFLAIDSWLEARDNAVKSARKLQKLNIHKQIINRILEPFSTITEVITGTDFGNFFNLRVHKDVQPEFLEVARRMLELYDKAYFVYRDWHLPFIKEEEEGLDLQTKIKVSFTRCARASYVNFYGKNDIEADVKRCDDLVKLYHLSPAEHQAQGMNPENIDYDRSEFTCNGDVYRNRTFFDWAVMVANEKNKVSGFNYYYANFNGWRSYRKTIVGENRPDFNKDKLMKELNEKS